jgi:uncharacterized protein (TIGR02996 family)
MDEGAFIRMIREHPDDDGPRLVFADWLEEQGDADRAEFIRVQVELAGAGRDQQRATSLKERERALQSRHWDRWLNPFGNRVLDAEFRHGLLEAVQMSAVSFLQYWPLLVERSPVRAVRLIDVQEYGPELGACPALQWIRTFDLGKCYVDGPWLEAFLASPYLHSLESLDLFGNELNGDDVAMVLESLSLPGLRALRLSHNLLAGGSFLGVDARLPRLESLDLSHNQLRPVGAEELAAAPLLAGLTKLDLSWNELDPAGVEALVASPHLGNLTELRLNINAAGDHGAIAVAGADNLPALERLELSANHIGPPGARALAQSHHLGTLRHLDLRKNRFGRSEARLLERRFGNRVLL